MTKRMLVAILVGWTVTLWAHDGTPTDQRFVMESLSEVAGTQVLVLRDASRTFDDNPPYRFPRCIAVLITSAGPVHLGGVLCADVVQAKEDERAQMNQTIREINATLRNQRQTP